MIYAVALVNPKTNEERETFVALTAEDLANVPCLHDFVLMAAQRKISHGFMPQEIPDGFMPIAGRVREVALQ